MVGSHIAGSMVVTGPSVASEPPAQLNSTSIRSVNVSESANAACTLGRSVMSVCTKRSEDPLCRRPLRWTELEQGAPMNEGNERAFLRLVRSWERGGLDAVCAAIRELFTDTTVWVQPGLPTATGPDEAVAIVETWGAASVGYELEVRHVASTDDAVLVERVETFRGADGSVFLTLPVVGVAEFRDGKITVWREYYDSAVVPGLGT